MKILLINVSLGQGSTGRICSDLADVIESNGDEVKIAYGRNFSDDDRGYKIGNKKDVLFHVLKTRFFDMHGLGSVRSTKKFIKWIDDYNPDIIHIHNIHGYYVNYKLLFNHFRNKKYKVICTMHDCWNFTGHCTYFSKNGCEKWITQCEKCKYMYEYPKSWVIDNCKNNFKSKIDAFNSIDIYYVTVSKWLEQIVKKSRLKVERIKTIYNGIDMDVFHPVKSKCREKYNLTNRFVVLGVASTWTERKGLDTFIKLSKLLPLEYNIVLIGLSESQKKLLPPNIIAIDKIYNTQQLVEWYSTADLFFNSSVEETMGMTTLESLACGTPVLVFDKTAIPEVVSESCGVVINLCDSIHLNKVIVETDWSKFTSDNCVRQASKFKKSLKYEEYYSLYKEIVFNTLDKGF